MQKAARPDLAAALTPDFTIGCKRILMSNDYYPALKQPNASVVTQKMARITPTGIVTADGVEHEVDTIIFGSGFKVGEGPIAGVTITGRDGVKLSDMIESQTSFILDALRAVDEAGAIDTRRDRQDAFNAGLQQRLEGSVWTAGGCASWYLDGSGRNRTLWPGYTLRLPPPHAAGEPRRPRADHCDGWGTAQLIFGLTPT